MNKWLRRAVGTVGLASGIWLLGSGAAHADDSTTANDPQHLSEILDNLLTPAGGPTNLGLTLDTPSTRADAGFLPDGPFAFSHGTGRTGATAHLLTADGQPQDVSLPDHLPNVMEALPITDVLPREFGNLASAQPLDRSGTEGTRTESLTGLPLPLLNGGPPVGDAVPVLDGAGSALGGAAPALGAAPAATDGLLGALPAIDGLTGALPLDGGLPVGDPASALGDPTSALGDPASAVGGLTGALPLGALPLDGALPLGALPLGGGLPAGDGSDAVPAADVSEPTESLPILAGLLGGDGLPVLGSLLGGLPASGDVSDAPADVVARVTDQSESLPVAGDLLGAAEGLPVFGSLVDRLPLGTDAVDADPTQAEGVPLVGNVPLVDNLPIFRSVPLVGQLA